MNVFRLKAVRLKSTKAMEHWFEPLEIAVLPMQGGTALTLQLPQQRGKQNYEKKAGL
ncbi:MAG: hypothetical protein QM786_19170 [Breznakibacter sp.]